MTDDLICCIHAENMAKTWTRIRSSWLRISEARSSFFQYCFKVLRIYQGKKAHHSNKKLVCHR